jgi:hypothetical protein
MAFCLGAQLSYATGGEDSGSGDAKNGTGKKEKVSEKNSTNPSEYAGPYLRIILDKDKTAFGNSGITFKVLRLRSSPSAFLDITAASIPPSIDIPMEDWEFGVPSDIPQYNMVPLKLLVGKYHDGQMNYPDFGNSYYDIPIKLTNGKEINPRHYYIDPVQTYAKFRTDEENGIYPLLEAVEVMIKTKDFGPLFRILALAARPELPVHISILSASGHSQKEWDMVVKRLIEEGLFAPGSKIDVIYSMNNPALNWNDATSTSQYGRYEDGSVKDKMTILTEEIDNVLTRRIDRENGDTPRPNVLMYGDDNPDMLEAARELFDTKVRAVLDHDLKMRLGLPPIRLILVNVAHEQYLTPVPSALTSNPSALSDQASKTTRISVYDSNFRYKAGAAAVQKIETKDKDIEVTAIAQFFGVSEAEAKRALSGDVNCDALLKRGKANKGSGK